MTGDVPPASPSDPLRRSSARSSSHEARSPSKNCMPESELTCYWSARSLERRQFFQDLFNTFYEQILHGCKDASCKTPTCASYRRKISKGPFRPHTVLSARALAAHLASEDHPSKKICPHMKAQQAATRSTEFKNQAGAYLKNERSTLTSPCPTSKIAPTRLKKTLNGINPKPRAKSTLSAAEKSSSEDSESETDIVKHLKVQKSASYKKPRSSEKVKGSISKSKDPKSLTQNLFDSASMTLLQLAKIPQVWLFSASAPNDPATESESECTVECNTAKHPIHAPDTRFSGIENHRSRTTLALELPDESWQREQNPGAKDGTPPVDGSQSFEILKDEAFSEHAPTQSEYEVLRSHCEICQFKSDQGNLFLFFIPKRLIDKPCHPLHPSARLQLSRQPIARDLLNSVKAAMAQHKDSQIKEDQKYVDTERELLRRLGRTDNHTPFLHCAREHQDLHSQIYPRYAQSVSHTLSSSDTLLQSYVTRKTWDSESTRVFSDKFSDMVEGFRVLHKSDPYPSHIFSCLWQSTSSLCVSKPSRFKGLGVEEQLPTRLPSIAYSKIIGTLSHTAAAHVTKLIFAALVASVQGMDPQVWTVVQRLRKSGHIALPENSEVSSSIKRTVADTLTVMDAFDEDMARLLLKKVTRALATRIHLPDARIFQSQANENKEAGPVLDIITLIVRGLTDPEAIAMLQRDSNCRPTLRDGSPLGEVPRRMAANRKLDETTKVHLEIVVEWLRGILLREWDGNPEVLKCSAVGGALELLDCLYKYYGGRHLSLEIFQTTWVSERLDMLNVPSQYMEFPPHDNNVHMLRYSFLFPPSILVSYFRAINHTKMSKASEEAMANSTLASRMTFANTYSGGRGRLKLEDRLSKLTDHYLVLNIRREEVLTDAMNQLWRRRKRELMRPLKVRLGHDEGEEGVDHGGVQQEFFRIAIAEALDPKYGAFTNDPVTRMSWFQVRSFEPLYKYELLGIVVSLAVYNGLTLPFTFPLALYMKLLHHEPDHLEDIADGWPELTKGLAALRDWEDGDVEDVFLRDYVFSTDVFGQTLNIDMSEQSRQRQENFQRMSASFEAISNQPPLRPEPNGTGNDLIENYNHSKTPSNEDQQYSSSGAGLDAEPIPVSSTSSPFRPSPTPPAVTNANRDQYIRDYIHHLTDASIRSQYKAFANGFTTCISPKSLSLFTPRTLKELVEGLPNINTHDLQSVTVYEGGYHETHPVIEDFWTIVHGWGENNDGQDKLRHLLEFVTASDRLPVGGMSRVIFVIQKNGVGDERLPTSLTCFGRLLLPEFSRKEVLERMLGKAVQNSKGFGQP